MSQSHENVEHAPHDPAHGHDDHHGGDDHGGNGKYWVVFVLLCLLTTCSFLTYFEWWEEAIPVSVSRAFMMAVSCGKALLVMLFFMHLIWEANWKWVLTVPAGMMSIFLMCMLIPDIGLRTNHYSNQRWLHAPQPVIEHVDSDHGPSGDH
ncbi:MAG: cytochrome C oxidase subunit IV family protein [Pirellulaceae bacterium]